MGSRAQRVALFIAIAFLSSWSLALAFHVFGGDIRRPEGRAISILYVLTPALAALIVQGGIAKRPVAEPLGLKPRLNGWVFLAWVLPVIILAVAFVLVAALPGMEVITSTEAFVDRLRDTLPKEALEDFETYLAENAPPHPALLIFQGMLGGVVNILFGLGEELGWRGYLLAEIAGGFWRRSLITGAVWGVWLVPWVLSGFLYPDHPMAGAAMVFGYTLLLSPVLVLLRARSGTVWAPALTRGTLMALATPAAQLTVGGSDLTKPFAGVVGLVAIALVVGTVVGLARRRPRRA